MKTALGVIIGVIVGIAVVAGGMIVALNSFGASGTTQKPAAISPSPAVSPSPVVAPPAPSPSPAAPSKSPLPGTPIPTGTAPTLKAGIWEFTIVGISGSGLTQTITAKITNTGAADASGTQAKIEVFSQQQRVKLNGQDFIIENLGTVKANTSVTRQETVTLGVTDAMRIVQNGARFVLTVTSDKGTETLNYDYKP